MVYEKHEVTPDILGPDEPFPVLMTTAEVAALAKVGEPTPLRWAQQGRVRVFLTPGGHYRYCRTSVYEKLGLEAPTDQPEWRDALKIGEPE